MMSALARGGTDMRTDQTSCTARHSFKGLQEIAECNAAEQASVLLVVNRCFEL